MDISALPASTLNAHSGLANVQKGQALIKLANEGLVDENVDKGKVPDDKELRQTFNDFVGQTFFSHLLSAMRKTVGKPAYFHGGRAEEVFQGQLDQAISEELSNASAASFADPMYELAMLPRG